MSLDGFQILHINVRSIPKNFNEVISYIQRQSVIYHIILLSETWLTEADGDLYQIPSYNHLDVHRVIKKGGGIRLYYLDEFVVNLDNTISGIFNSHESLFVKISKKNRFSLTLGCIYRPPSASMTNFNEYLSAVLFADGCLKGNCILIGDFNIDLLKIRQIECFRNFENIMRENGFRALINSPTRCSGQTGLPQSILDHVWVNFYKDISAGVLDYLIADHLPIKVKINLSLQNTLRKLSFRILSDEKFEMFEHDKYNLFDQYNIDSDDVNLELIRFEAWTQKILDRYFPIKTKFLSNKRIKMPWINNEILELINKKHKLFKSLKHYLIPYSVYKAYSNLLRMLLDRLRKLYFKRKFESCQNNSGKVWKSINQVMGRNKKGSTVKQIVNSEGQTVTEKKAIATEFNNYFNNIPSKTQAKLNPALHEYDHLIQRNNRTMFMRPATLNEVVSVIGNLPNKNNSLQLPLKFLKYVKYEIAVILCTLFNLCIEQGTYPDNLKIAKIIPLYKSGSHCSLTNYRPISLLPLINKIFEKLLYVRIDCFFEECNIISQNQFGFRKSRDTQRATLKLITSILPALSNMKCVGCVFLDFSKAFDTVNHPLLLSKLERYGVRGICLDLVQSYLSNRKHYVSIDDEISESLFSTVGVPQGSCLGPLLFLIYTNDLNYLLNRVDPVLFADDTSIVYSNNDATTVGLQLNYCLYSILDWCNYNKLALNNKKSKWMFFSRRRAVNIPVLYIDNVEIERLETFKYLGFHLDTRLCHDFHVRSLCTRLSRLSHITRRVKNYLTLEASKNLYYALVHSIVSYGLLVWGGKLMSGPLSHKLRRLQNKIIFNLFSLPHESMDDINRMYKRTGILKFHDLFHMQTCTAIYKILNENYASFLYDILVENIRDHEHNTRYRSHFLLPYPGIKNVKTNFIYMGISLWNNLENTFKDAISSKELKTRLKNKFIDSY
jgi:hypothetical protein